MSTPRSEAIKNAARWMLLAGGIAFIAYLIQNIEGVGRYQRATDVAVSKERIVATKVRV